MEIRTNLTSRRFTYSIVAGAKCLLMTISLASTHLAWAAPGQCWRLFAGEESTSGRRVHYSKDFAPPDLKVYDLADNNGNLFLFRVAGDRYQEGETGFWQRREHGRISYSLNPFIAELWHPKEDGFIMIAAPSIHQVETRLAYKTVDWRYNDLGSKDTILAEENYSRGRPDFLLVALSENTTVREAQGFENFEVQIPPERHRPLLEIPKQEFREIVASFGSNGFTISELVQAIRSSNSVRLLDPRM